MSAQESTTEKVVEVVKDITHAAKEFVDQMDTTEEEEVSAEVSESTPETEEKEGESSEGKKLTMKDREAKLAQLRKKFVSQILFDWFVCEKMQPQDENPAHKKHVPSYLNNRLPRQKRIDNLLSKKVPKPSWMQEKWRD